jgi:hypothetical protein
MVPGRAKNAGAGKLHRAIAEAVYGAIGKAEDASCVNDGHRNSLCRSKCVLF